MKYSLQDLIDIRQMQRLQDGLYAICPFTLAILDMEGNILTASGWQDICTQYHRKHPECERKCRLSDQYILSRIHEANPYVSYRCQNGLVDAAVPIIIDGVHYGNCFTGQLFMEEPDLDFFRAQARTCGFDEDAYLRAVKKVPIRTSEQLDSYLNFMKRLIIVISEIGLKKLKEEEARKQIESSEQLCKTLLDNIPDPTWIKDSNGVHLEVNQAWRKFTGLQREEVIGKTDRDIYSAELASRFEMQDRHVIEAAQAKYFEELFRDSRGRDLTFETFKAPVTGPHGEVTGTIGLARDITGRKKLEEQLRQSQKMEAIGQLAGGVAHDFNNIMAATMMQLSFLQRNASLDSDAQAALAELMAGAKRAASLTSQLLMFGRRSVLELKVLDLNEAVANLLNMLRRLIGENINLRFEQVNSLPAVEADVRMVEQVVVNLAVNARDAMPKGGLITIRLEPVQSERQPGRECPEFACGLFVCLSVSDTGCGMDKDTLQHIFEPFFTTKDVGAGSGLGLAVVQGIMAQHKGWVDVESTPGKGSAFKVFFPAAAKPVSAPVSAERAEIQRGRETILLVEDEQGLRLLVARGLSQLGYRVLQADNGQSAMNLWQEHGHNIDLLFSDMLMPEGITGLELADKLKQRKPGLKVIISSGYNLELSVQGKAPGGKVAYLQKPYDFEVLSKAVRDCLDAP